MALKIFPLPLTQYEHLAQLGLFDSLWERIKIEPFNLVAFIIFIGAILHTFYTSKFKAKAHVLDLKHRESGGEDESFVATLCEFLGEVEVVFGLWAIPLLLSMWMFSSWESVTYYINHKVAYAEPLFVGIIMAIASSKPIMICAEEILKNLAKIGHLKPSAWWLAILVVGPLMGSLITEPAAMTIAALLLAKQFYHYGPSVRLKYATLGLLFVNISIGGTLTHFAAPPIVMVVNPWKWHFLDVFLSLGWKAACAIIIGTVSYYWIFKKDLNEIDAKSLMPVQKDNLKIPAVPFWVISVHIAFLAWTVINLHVPALCVGGFLFYLGFLKATMRYQNRLSLISPLLVMFFLAGLITHGSLQGWWLEIILSRLDEIGLFLGSTVLTAFNDNAAITFLATLVPSLSQNTVLQHAVVAGAVTGGGLTVIANAPNPAGQSILSHFFQEGISPLYLFLGALWPTFIAGAFLMLL